MKTTKSRISFALLIACVGLVYSCTKNNAAGSNSTTTTADVQTQSDDDAQVSTESDAVSNDVNTALYSSVTVSGSSAGAVEGSGRLTVMGGGVKTVDSTITVTDTMNTTLICDASFNVKDSGGIRTVTITYNGTNCWGDRTRTGTVVISMPVGTYWRDAGATVSVSIQNLTITRKSDNKVIVINGTKTITNVSGGLLIDLATLGTITHTISGSLSITFPNGSTRVWGEAKKRVFTYNDGVVITTTGTHTDSLSNSDVAEWGVDRFGNAFESLITQPKVFAQSCDFLLTSGQNEILTSEGITATITYGLNSSGDATGCPTGNATYYYKLLITLANGKTYTFIEPYY